jgi:hypothetical protein
LRDCRTPTSSRIWFPQSENECSASASIAPDRVKYAATLFTLAMIRLITRDWTM